MISEEEIESLLDSIGDHAMLPMISIKWMVKHALLLPYDVLCVLCDRLKP